MPGKSTNLMFQTRYFFFPFVELAPSVYSEKIMSLRMEGRQVLLLMTRQMLYTVYGEKPTQRVSFINTREIIQLGNKIGEKIHPAKLTRKVRYCTVFICRSIGGKLLVSAFSLIKASFFSYLFTCMQRHLHS